MSFSAKTLDLSDDYAAIARSKNALATICWRTYIRGA